MADTKYKFSPGVVAGAVAVFWIVVFGLVVAYGMNGLSL